MATNSTPTTSTWNGSNDNWDTAADWTGGVLPGASSAVVIPAGTPLIDTDVGTVASVDDQAGGLNIFSGALAVTGNFSNSGTVNVDTSYGTGGGGSTLTVGGTLTNTGSVYIGDPYADQKAPTTVTVGALSNTGTLQVNSEGASVPSTLNVQSAAGFGQTGSLTGSVFVLQDASVVFASGQITDIALNSQLTLGNADSVVADANAPGANSALTGLATIEGGLALYAGASINASGNLTNSGTIYLDSFYALGGGGSSLTVNGVLTNVGTLDVGDQYVDQNAGSTVTVDGLANSGTINLTSAGSKYLAALDVESAAGAITGNINLSEDSLLEFASGQVASIATGAELSLSESDAYVADAGALTSNSALTGLGAIQGALNLANGASVTTDSALAVSGVLNIETGSSFAATGAVANTGSVDIDTNYGAGGSSFSVGGVLTNNGVLDMEGQYDNLSANDTAMANGLVNTGTVTLVGSSSAVATLAIAGAAENEAGKIDVGNAGAFTVKGSYLQTAPAELELQLNSAGTSSSVAVTGSADIAGGSLWANTSGATLAAGQTYNLVTFTPGELQGVYDTLQVDNSTGPSTDVNLGNGLTAGLVYDDALGNIQLQVVATPTSTADAWTGGTGDWGAASDWSNGAPMFYSDVTIGASNVLAAARPLAAVAATSSAPAVTLSHDATIDSLVLNQGSLTTDAGTDLTIGTTLAMGAGSSLTIGGESFVDGVSSIGGTVTVAGLLDLRGAVTDFAAGAFTIDAAATLELGAADGGSFITFAGAGATLKLDQPSQFTGTLADLAAGDVIDVAGVKVASASVSGGNLTFSDSNGNNYSYAVTGFAGAGIVTQDDGQGGTKLIVSSPTSVTLNQIEGTNTLNAAQANSGFSVGGSVTGLAAGKTFTLNVTDGASTASYTATVNADGATWTAAIPAGALVGFPDGSATFTAVVNASTQASQPVAIHETAPTVSVAAIDSGNFVDAQQAQSGFSVSGASTGLTTGATVTVKVVDGSFSNTYTATVANGGWSVAIPAGDTATLADGSATFTASATDAYGNAATPVSQTVTVATKAPTVTASESVSGTTTQTSDKITVTAAAETVGTNAIASVLIYDGATEIGAATPSGAQYSVTASSLALGAHNFSVKTTDTAGNTTTTSLAAVNVVSNQGPTVTASESAPGLTNVTKETITETATAATGLTVKSVEVFDGSTDLGAATLSAGVWSLTTKTLADGVHALSTVTTDSVGNTTTTMLPAVDIATAKPTVTVSQSLSGVTNQTSDIVTETAVAETVGANAIKSVEVFDGSTDLGAATLSGGIWSLTAKALADGAHTLSTVTTDAAGNVANATLATVDIATQKPTVTASESVSGTTTLTSDTITATATAEAVPGDSIASVLVFDGANKLGAATLSNGQYTFTASPLALGAHSFSLQTTDTVGNITTTSLAPVTVTTSQPPTVSASESRSGPTNLATDTITETATAATGLTIQSVEVLDGTKALGAATLANGVWTFTTGTLADGAHTLSTLTTDSAGHTTTTALAPLDVATQAPTVTASTNPTGPTNKTSVTISGTAKAEAVPGDSILQVEALNGAAPLGSATLNATTGAWTYTTSGLTDGVYNFDVVTVDAAGNETTTNLAPVDVATKAPSVTASQSVSGLTNKTTDTISETATAEAIGTNAIASVKVFDGATALGSATLANGTWSLTTPTLADGVHTLSTVTTDTAGNVTTTTLAAVDVATKGPTVTASQSVSGPTDKTVDTISETAMAEAVGANAIASVKVFDGATALGSATLSNGTWSLMTPTLADGVHNLTTVTTDTVGNVTTTTLAAVDVATKAPTVTASEAYSGLTTQRTNTITETAVAEAVGPNTIKSVEIYDLFNGATSDLGAASLSNGTWSFTTGTLAYGVHTLSTVTTDTAGNTVKTTLAPDNVEPPPPNVVIALQTDSSKGKGVTNNDALTGSGDPNATVSFAIDGVAIAQTATANASGIWSFTPAGLSQGVHTIVASETNGGGTGKASLTFTYDTVAPSVAIATSSGSVANAAETIEGTGEVGTTVQLYDGVNLLGGPVTVGANGQWTDTVTLLGGANAITAHDTDIAGNVGVSATTTLTLDNQIVGQPNQFLLLGTAGADHITVGAANIVVATLGGDDTVTLTSAGGAGQFHVIGGGGGSDTLDLSQTAGGANVNLATDTATGSQIGTNYVFNFSNIIGGGGAETLVGANGGGTIQAGSGADVMTGGAGMDTYSFLSPFGVDTITNFVAAGAGHSTVLFDHSLFANVAAVEAALTDTSAGAEIALSATESITMKGVTKATLEANSAADFRFT